MAIDLSREISFKDIGRSLGQKGRKSNQALPSKTTINLIAQQKTPIDRRKTALIAVIAAVVLVLFAKFAVFDFLERVNGLDAEVAQKQEQLAALNSQLVGYADVQAEYDSYESAQLTNAEASVSALEALEIVDEFIRPVSSVSSVSYASDTITLNITGISLDGIGALVKTLDAQDAVASVMVSTAATQQMAASDVTAALTISLQDGLGDTL